MAIASPTPDGSTRWRCRQCGNLTRFDVTRSTRAVEFVHFDLAGVPAVEERAVRSDLVEQVRCRWCDGVDTVDVIARNDSDDSDDSDDADAKDAADDDTVGVVGGSG